jgi:hypothetical protein
MEQKTGFVKDAWGDGMFAGHSAQFDREQLRAHALRGSTRERS